jgi:hypothetical protein
MPQLDTLTFFSQYFWLSLFFFGFYIALVKFYLPKISRIFKIRSMKIASAERMESLGGFKAQDAERPSDRRSEALILKGLNISRLVCAKSLQTSHQWVKKIIVKLTNQHQLKKVNTLYFSKFGNLYSNQSLLFYHLKTVTAPKGFLGLNNLLGSIENFQSENTKSLKEKMYTFRIFQNILK